MLTIVVILAVWVLLSVPMSVHARHTVDDVLTAFGILDFNKTAWKQTGVI